MRESVWTGASKKCSTDDGHIHFIKTFKDICRDHATRNLLISISVVGLATAGITCYDEPLCAFSGMGEGNVNTVLLIQPIASLAINVLTGILADKMERRYVVQMGIALSLISGMAFTLGVGHGVSSVLLGILWGCMNGFYFSAEELINLMVMESVECVGRRKGVSYVHTVIWNRRSAGDICNKSGCGSPWHEIGQNWYFSCRLLS